MKRLELLIQELRVANAIDNDTCQRGCEKLGHADLDTALEAEINNPERERYLVLKTKISLTSQHIKKMETVVYKSSPEYKLQLFKSVFKDEIRELARDTGDTDIETLRTLAVSIEADLKENKHDNEDIIMVDGQVCDGRDSESMARAVMCYLDVEFKEVD